MLTGTALALAGAAAQQLAGCTLYVGFDGSDEWSGRSPDQPLRSLGAARRVVQFSNIREVVCIGPGTYRETLTLGPEDARTEATSVTWRSAEGPGSVRLSGGVDVVFGPLPPDDPARSFVNSSVAEALVVADLFAAGVPVIPDFVPRGGFEWSCKPGPLMLIVDGWTQTVARWPNAEAGEYGGPYATTEPVGGDKYARSSNFFQADASTPLAGWKDTANVWAHGYWWWDWSDQWLRVSQVTVLPGGQLNVSVTPAAPSNITAGARYYLANSLDALDAPGEFFTNTTSGNLYFWPARSHSRVDSTSPISGTVTVNQSVVDAVGLAFHTFQDLVFEAVTGDAFSCTQCNHVMIINSTIHAAGAAGVSCYQCNSSAVIGGSVIDTGGAGVRFVDGGDRRSLTPSGNQIAHANISWFQTACSTYNAGARIDTGGVIEHNEVAHSGHIGVTLYGNDIMVRFNVLHDLVMDTFDCGAIYWFPNDWTLWNTSIVANFLYQNGAKPTRCNTNTQNFRASVYMDNAGAGLTVAQNVIWQPVPAPPPEAGCDLCSTQDLWVAAINNDGGRSSSFFNNIVVDTFSLSNRSGSFNSAATFNSGGMLTWDTPAQQNSSALYEAMRSVQWNQGLFAAHYPALAQLEDGFYAPTCATSDWRCPAAPWNCSFTTNVLVNVSQVMLFPSANSHFSPSNFNLSNNLVTGDPGWAVSDPRESLDFQLAPSSPAYALGFQPIPMNCFGPWRCV